LKKKKKSIHFLTRHIFATIEAITTPGAGDKYFI
jgi:hypothetical protein